MLSIAVVNLKTEIKAAFKGARDDGNGGKSSDEILENLSTAITSAIDAYVSSAVVQVTLVNTAVIGASPTGPVVGTGIGTGTGQLL